MRLFNLTYLIIAGHLHRLCEFLHIRLKRIRAEKSRFYTKLGKHLAGLIIVFENTTAITVHRFCIRTCHIIHTLFVRNIDSICTDSCLWSGKSFMQRNGFLFLINIIKTHITEGVFIKGLRLTALCPVVIINNNPFFLRIRFIRERNFKCRMLLVTPFDITFRLQKIWCHLCSLPEFRVG